MARCGDGIYPVFSRFIVVSYGVVGLQIRTVLFHLSQYVSQYLSSLQPQCIALYEPTKPLSRPSTSPIHNRHPHPRHSPSPGCACQHGYALGCALVIGYPGYMLGWLDGLLTVLSLSCPLCGRHLSCLPLLLRDLGTHYNNLSSSTYKSVTTGVASLVPGSYTVGT